MRAAPKELDRSITLGGHNAARTVIVQPWHGISD